MLNQSKISQNRYHPLRYWLKCHSQASLYAFSEIIRSPFTNFMMLIVISIAIALPSGLYILLTNFQPLGKSINEAPTITLFLKTNTTPQQLSDLKRTLLKNPKISSINYISPQQGLSELTKINGFSQIIADLKQNPLPGVFIINPIFKNQSPTELQSLFLSLKNLPQVENGQLNLVWIKRWYDLMSIGRRLVLSLIFIFGLGVMLIVFNTIRLNLQNHHHEINVLKLIGATSAFVRRPFLYRGIFYGLLSGSMAWLIIITVLSLLKPPIISLANTYHQTILINHNGIISFLKIIGISIFLAYIGTWLALFKPLNIEEEIEIN